MTAPSRSHQEGRFAIVTDVGRGMRWTWVASPDERGGLRTAKARGPDPPTLGSSPEWWRCRPRWGPTRR